MERRSQNHSQMFDIDVKNCSNRFSCIKIEIIYIIVFVHLIFKILNKGLYLCYVIYILIKCL